MAVDIRKHRSVGFGVIADNLMNIATFTTARAAAQRNQSNETTGQRTGRSSAAIPARERSFLHQKVASG
jgi:hypothetical protein